MKGTRYAWLLSGLLIAIGTSMGSAQPADSSRTDPESAFLGRWDLTLHAPDHDFPSWLELRQQGSTLEAQFVGRWGNARPLPKVEVSNGVLKFISPKEEEDSK